MRKYLFIFVMLLPLAFMSCEASDPLTEGIYNSDGFYAVDGGHLSREINDNGGYWHEYSLEAFVLSPGGSGATLINPNASSLGGYRLDAIWEYLYFSTHTENDWDGTTDAVLEIWFEVNVDNTGGLDTDTVKFQLEVWHKVVGERITTVYSLDGSTVVGKADQHDLFQQEIVVGDIRAGDVLSFRLNLNTILGEVDNVIVNYVEYKYQTYYPSPEVS